MTVEEVLRKKDFLLAQKRATIKRCDGLLHETFIGNVRTAQTKAEGDAIDPNKIELKIIGNSCLVIDSHMDCHIPGLWTKSLSEPKQIFLLQEHEMEFEKVIADSFKNQFDLSTPKISWSKLGANFYGKTEVLQLDVTIDNERNPFMFNQYAKGYVNQHSVGMRYVKYFLCAKNDNPNYSSENANWEKYYPMVVNKEIADKDGYFFAVTEAQLIEISAVVKGSNSITPTLGNSATKSEYCDTCESETDDLMTDSGDALCKGCGERRKGEPSDDTHKSEPSDDTQEIDWSQVVKSFNN